MNNSDTEDQLYDVEEILDYDENACKFLVRWTGFEGKDSWEPIENLNCPILISQYFMKQSFEARCISRSSQTNKFSEADNQSFIQIFKKGRPKEIMQTQKAFDTIIPYKIENIDIQSKEAKIISQDLPDIITVPIDWLTTNFPALVNQYFLNQSNIKEHS